MRWIKPVRGFCEGQRGCADLPTFKNSSKASAAAMARDEDDSLLGMFALVLESYTDAEAIEVVA